MELISKSIRQGKCQCAYKSSFPGGFDSALKLLYRVSSQGQVTLGYQGIDEPRGMDSDWRHERGNLTEGLSELEFLEKYSDYHVEWVVVSGVYKGIKIKVVARSENNLITIVFPETAFNNTPIVMLISLVEEICNGIAEEK